MATDFFAAQDAARSRSRRLVALFIASIAGLILAIYIAVMLFAVLEGAEIGHIWNPEIFLTITGITTLVVGLSSLGKIASLRSGGGSVARSVGGRKVEATTLDPDERRLINVVGEMSIAAGVPIPEIYVLDAEDGINAFAAGFSTSDAAVAVTRGGITKLTRDELQGVMAHEFSHILNGDMRLNIQLIGLVFGLLALSIVGRGMMRSAFYVGGRRRGNKEGGGLAAALIMLGLIIFAAGSLGVLFGRLLQSAVSRQREFLADASAVQFTRNPDGLAGALRKIGAAGSHVINANSQDVAHLFFASGLKSGWAGLFSTHPPLEDRIRALDPGWDGSFESAPPPLPDDPKPPPLPSTSSAGSGMMIGAVAAFNQLAHARSIREELTALLGDDLYNPAAACDIVRALLPRKAGDGESDNIRIHREKLSGTGPEQRLALVNILMPSLAGLSDADRAGLLRHLDLLGGADAILDAFDFGIWWIVRRNLNRIGRPVDTRTKLDGDPATFAPDVAILLASLAHVGADAVSFESAVAKSPSFATLCRHPEQSPDVAQLDQALQNLGNASFALRREIIAAATHAVTGDGKVTESEKALMQIVSLALDCPAPLPEVMPPFAGGSDDHAGSDGFTGSGIHEDK